MDLFMGGGVKRYHTCMFWQYKMFASSRKVWDRYAELCTCKLKFEVKIFRYQNSARSQCTACAITPASNPGYVVCACWRKNQAEILNRILVRKEMRPSTAVCFGQMFVECCECEVPELAILLYIALLLLLCGRWQGWFLKLPSNRGCKKGATFYIILFVCSLSARPVRVTSHSN